MMLLFFFYFFFQLILLMALARGKSQILCGPISLHTETAIHVAKLLTEVKKKKKEEKKEKKKC